jgi:hypothetical protein
MCTVTSYVQHQIEPPTDRYFLIFFTKIPEKRLSDPNVGFVERYTFYVKSLSN